jgi:hypothetical protein
MVLHRKLAICAFDLDFSRGASDAEYFVIISFGIRGQWYFSVLELVRELPQPSKRT